MKKTFICVGMIAVLLILLAGIKGGLSLVISGVGSTGLTVLRIGPLVLLAFGITGLMQGLIKPELIQRLLGRESGFKGIFLGGLAGAFMPGGPFIFYPLAITFLRGGAEIGAIIAFVAAKNLWSVMIISLEVALMGWPIFIARFLTTLPFPIIMGLMANYFFPRIADDVRDWLDGHDAASAGKRLQ